MVLEQVLLRKGNHIILITLLLAFISQSVAALSMPCSMAAQNSDNSMAMLAMGDMDHSNHNFDTDHAEIAMDTCCNHDNCPTNGCAASMVLSGVFNAPAAHIVSNKIDLYTLSFVNPVNISPYRPPIPR